MSDRVCWLGLANLHESTNFRIAGSTRQGPAVDSINTSEDTQRVPRTPKRHPRTETWDLRPQTMYIHIYIYTYIYICTCTDYHIHTNMYPRYAHACSFSVWALRTIWFAWILHVHERPETSKLYKLRYYGHKPNKVVHCQPHYTSFSTAFNAFCVSIAVIRNMK